MSIAGLAHCSVRTHDLEASRRFYAEVLGLRVGYRPPFDFPGLWLYAGDEAIVHIIAVDRGTKDDLGERDTAKGGTGAFDHIAFAATGLVELRARCTARGIAFRERTVPALELHQMFLTDPDGVTIELNYPASEPR
jgi:catechol 2,3-dioxygenase-like lactoylglutathione lyase family enzyme